MSKPAYLWLGRGCVKLCNRIITKTNGMNLSANKVLRVSRFERYVANAQPLFKVMCLLLTAFWLSVFPATAEIWTPPKSAGVLCECSSHGEWQNWRSGCLNVLDFGLSKSFWNRSRPSGTRWSCGPRRWISSASGRMWKGLRVAPEFRCSSYDRDDYRYPQSVEAEIVKGIGEIYGPYTGRCFGRTRDTDIEHIVATSEAHDSGLCAADLDTRRRFATDLLNLTLAAPDVNRGQKSGKDAAEWMPRENACWFADRIVEVRRKYNLTINFAEVAALERVLLNCASTEMVIQSCDLSGDSSASEGAETGTASSGTNALERWDEDGNGSITCAEAREHGIAPVERGHPAYKHMRDGDGDAWVCE